VNFSTKYAHLLRVQRVKFVICYVWPTQSQSSQSEDAFEVGEELLYLLSRPQRDRILLDFGDIAGELTSVFMFFFAGNFACIDFRVSIVTEN
jgi:hypothetical protein